MADAIQCRYCGSYNISINFDTGLSICNDCPPNKQIAHKAKKIDLDEMKIKTIETDEEEKLKLKQIGVTFGNVEDYNKKK